MVTLIIRKENGEENVIENVVDFDYIEKTYVEYIADTELSDEQLKQVEEKCRDMCHYPQDHEIYQIVHEVLGDEEK